jgi:periplasmic protein TonB
VVLVISTYFGWTRIHGKREATGAVAPVQTAQAPTPTQVPQSAPPQNGAVESKPAAGVIASPGQIEPVPGNRAGNKSADEESEVTITHPQTGPKQTLVVKSDLGATTAEKPQSASNVDAPAPALTASSGEQSEISNIMQSTTVAVPKVADQDSLLKISQGVTQGMLIQRVQPVYPAQARQMRLQGSVQLQAMISKQGNITSVKVLNGDPTLARSAVDAVKQWKYKPYYLNGEPVDIQTQVTVIFKLP